MENFLPADQLPWAVRRSPALLKLIADALQLAWNDGFRTGLAYASLGYLTLIATGLLFLYLRRR